MLPSQAGAAAALGRGSALGGSLNRTPTGRPGGGGGGGGGTRGANGGRVPGNGAGLGPGRLEREAAAAATTTPAPTAGALYSGSEGDSESGEEEELGAERRGLKRSLSEMELVGGPEAAAAATGGYGPVSGAVSGAKPGKKTRGRVKIKMEFIDNKLRRYTTFSKRKTGIMKKVQGPEAGRPRGTGRVGTRRGSPGGRQSRGGGERRRVRRRCVGGDGCYPGRAKGEGPPGKCGERGDARNVQRRGKGAEVGVTGAREEEGPCGVKGWRVVMGGGDETRGSLDPVLSGVRGWVPEKQGAYGKVWR